MKLRKVFVFLLALALLILPGCGKEYQVRKGTQPGVAFSQYDKLTGLIGTVGRNEVLDILEIELQEVNIENGDYLGIPMKESYAGLSFDVFLRFNHNNAKFYGVEYVRTYKYPEQQEEMFEDIKVIGNCLVKDFGEDANTNFVFNWAEKKMGETWDRDIKVWQDAGLLRRLAAKDFGGEFLWWDMTSVATETVLDTLKDFGKDAVHSLHFSLFVSEYNGEATITIGY